MKLDYCYYCEAFVSTHKHYNILGFFTFGIIGFKRVCNHCGYKTYKRKYSRGKKSLVIMKGHMFQEGDPLIERIKKLEEK